MTARSAGVSSEEGPGAGASRLRFGFNRGAELVARSAKLPHGPGHHSPDLGEPFRPDHQQGDHKDEEQLLKASAELKHDVTLRGLTSPLEPRHDPGLVVVER